MIFPILETEDVVQIGDMTRISAVKSFISKDSDPISKVEIKPEASADWVEVTGTSSADWYLDWAFAGASRSAVPSVRVTTSDGATPTPATETASKDGAIALVTAADDNLFSKDQDLVALEPDILKWVPEGRASFLNIHRAAQGKILEALDESGIVDNEGAKLTKAAVVDISEVGAWSRDLTLQLIFKGLSNAVDDVFSVKSKHYGSEAEKRKARAVIRLDLDGDGVIEDGEQVDSFQTMELLRR